MTVKELERMTVVEMEFEIMYFEDSMLKSLELEYIKPARYIANLDEPVYASEDYEEEYNEDDDIVYKWGKFKLSYEQIEKAIVDEFWINNYCTLGVRIKLEEF